MKIDVPHVAKLAGLKLTTEEIEKFERQLSEILAYVKQLDKVDTKNVEQTSQVTGLENIFRDDVACPSLPQEQVIAQAKAKHNNLFQVKGVFEA